MPRDPLILEIKGSSLDDGPGIRTVIFFKGCPLDCSWCQNPESKSPEAQLAYDAKECVGCGSCIDTCPRDALSQDNPFFVDRTKCDLCFECVEACPAEALRRVGSEMTVADVVAQVKKDLPFFRTSGGCATLSGGEAAMHVEFAGELLEQLRSLGIHTIIETCGYFKLENFIELMYPHLDHIYFDVKLALHDQHKQHCGVSNSLILENFHELNERAGRGGVPLLPRVPLVPGVTATEENLKALAGLLRLEKACEVCLLRYNPLWPEKAGMLGMEPPPDPPGWMDEKEFSRCREILESSGISVVSAGGEKAGRG